MDARRREADHQVAGDAARAVDQAFALDDADARPGEVELVLAVDARQLGRLAADQRAAGLAADLGRALDELGDLLELDPVRGDVVEEKERLGAARDHVVDAVRGQVGAASRAARPARARIGFVPTPSVEPRAGAGRRAEEPGEGERAEPSRARPVDSTAARSRSTTASAVASETPAAAYVRSSLTLALYEVGRRTGQASSSP